MCGLSLVHVTEKNEINPLCVCMCGKGGGYQNQLHHKQCLFHVPEKEGDV